MRLIIDGKLCTIKRTDDGTSHGYQGIHVLNDNNQPVARHTVPREWLEREHSHVARTGGHTYQHHGVWSK